MGTGQAAVVLGLVSCVLGFNIDTSNPIVYQDVTSNTSDRGSYFGYTVLLNSNYSLEQVPRLLIGAPRSNSKYLREVIEPGVVYSCPYLKKCEELYLDSTGNEMEKTVSVASSRNIWDLKDHAWIGGAMDSERELGGRIVICGPRWINQYYKQRRVGDYDYYMTGLCYSKYNEELPQTPATRMIPTADKQNINFHLRSGAVYGYYAQSEAGLSVHLMPDSKDAGMLLGAPGLLNWNGGLVEYPDKIEKERQGRNRRSADKYRKVFQDPRVVNPYYSRDVDSDHDYLGYQVSSGHFFSLTERVYAVSAPRGSNFRGYVKILKYPKISAPLKRSSIWTNMDQKEGQEFGEYFGYSLAVADVDGDGYDDLVVGAPLYSDGGKRRETGRVHVFLGNPEGRLQRPDNGGLIEGASVGGRFGLAVVCLRDIDQDGYHDVAVGAPYEDDGRGVVYIFNGSPLGLKPQYSQRIAAADVDLSLRGFGVSISPPDDMDGNRYDDVAVGAFLSGHVVLFRTSPVVSLNLSVVPSVELLFNRTSAFTVTVCQTYSGSNAPPSINVTRGLKIDDAYRRVKYNASEREVVLRRGIPECETVEVEHKYNEEMMESLKITAYQDIVRRDGNKSIVWMKPLSEKAGEDMFCSSCPVVDQDNFKKEASVILEYGRECQPCICDLHLSCDLLVHNDSLNGQFVLGSSDKVQLFMTVSNDGDVSYGTSVMVSLPPKVNIGNLPAYCQEELDGLRLHIVCTFKRPIRQGEVHNMSLDLDMSSVEELADMAAGAIPDIVLRVEVASRSSENNPADNVALPRLQVSTEADFTIQGQSKEELYSYVMKEKDEDKTPNVEFLQTYQFVKVGPSPVQELRVQFLIPLSWTASDIAFLSLYQPKDKSREQSLKCMSDIHFLRRPSRMQRLVEGGSEEVEHHLEKRSADGERTTTPQLGHGSRVHEYPSNRSLYLNCSTPEVLCRPIDCVMMHFKGNSFEVELTMFLDVQSLEPLMEDKDIIHVSTEARVSIQRPVGMRHSQEIGPDHIMVSSTFTGALPMKGVALWIIILSILAGILLLLLLIYIMYKRGFFRRKKREHLVELKKADRGLETHEGPLHAMEPYD